MMYPRNRALWGVDLGSVKEIHFQSGKTTTMKAIRIGDYGDRSVLRCEEAPEPELLPDDVLIRVHAAGVNPADCQFRRGDYRAFAPLQMPAILGWDVAGTVDR